MQQLTLERATLAIQATLAHARKCSLAPLAVVVLDNGGHVRAAVREDGSGIAGIAIASAKARGALSFSMSSRAVGEVFGGNPLLASMLAVTLEGQLLPIPGALLIRDTGNAIIGCIAAAGDAPDNDEAAAAAGLEAASVA
jgi:uncharacterized protein GlcG (DUF336 family)